MGTECNKDRPDVEAIVADIRRTLDARGGGSAAGDPPGDPTYEEDIGLVNRAYAGAPATLRKAVYRALGLDAFHAAIVRLINRLVTATRAERTRDSVEMLEQFSSRLGAYDDLRIAERLKRLEERLESRETP